MEDTRIVFMGTPSFASNILEGLVADGRSIVAVVTQTDKKVGRKQVLTYSPVKEVALAHNIPILQPERLKSSYEEVLAYEPDMIIVCAYGQMIPKAILDYPKYGCINTHGSLLPKYRGGAPIQRAIMEGDKETGITLMYMAEKMDAGDIIFQEKISIEDTDTSTTLFAKMSDLALNMLRKYLDDIIAGNVLPQAQDESEVTFAYNLKKEDEYIDFGLEAKVVYDHIRGLLDEPVGYALLDGRKYKFYKARYVNEALVEPYKVYGLYDGALAVGAKNGTVLIDIIQSEGKKAMTAKDFYNGVGKTLVGQCFAPCPKD